MDGRASIFLVHVLASLQVALLYLSSSAESKANLGVPEHTQAHRVVLSSNSPHVWHLARVQQLVTCLHLRTFEHLQLINRLLHVISIECACPVMRIPAAFSLCLETRSRGIEGQAFLAEQVVLQA